MGVGWSIHGGDRTWGKVEILFFCGPFAGLRQFVARQRVAFRSSVARLHCAFRSEVTVMPQQFGGHRLRSWPTVAAAAWAGCGSAVCSINTNWDAQGAWTEAGRRFDLRYEFIESGSAMSGDSRVGVGEIPRHHDEVRPSNRNWIATLDYAFSQRLGVSSALPVVDRSHDHIHNHGGGQFPENWNFTEAGDPGYWDATTMASPPSGHGTTARREAADR